MARPPHLLVPSPAGGGEPGVGMEAGPTADAIGDGVSPAARAHIGVRTVRELEVARLAVSVS